MSTGEPNTLERWIALSISVWGTDSPQVKFLQEKAANSPNGVKEEVVAHESQMLYLLMSMGW